MRSGTEVGRSKRGSPGEPLTACSGPIVANPALSEIFSLFQACFRTYWVPLAHRNPRLSMVFITESHHDSPHRRRRLSCSGVRVPLRHDLYARTGLYAGGIPVEPPGLLESSRTVLPRYGNAGVRSGGPGPVVRDRHHSPEHSQHRRTRAG